MRAREAAKLHKGDRIVLKHTGEEVIVAYVEDTSQWGVWVKTEEGHDAHNKEIKGRAAEKPKVTQDQLVEAITKYIEESKEGAEWAANALVARIPEKDYATWLEEITGSDEEGE